MRPVIIAAIVIASAGAAWADPPPRWVELVDLPAEVPTVAEGAGEAWLLSDVQRRFVGDRYERFHRYAAVVLTDEGVAGQAEPVFYVAPDRERVDVHFIRRIRDGVAIDVTDDADIGPHPDGDAVAAVIPDVRPGDTIDVAYTISGTGGIAPGRIAGHDYLVFQEPVQRTRWRLIAPASTPLRIDAQGIVGKPERRERDGVVDYLWDLEAPAALPIPEDAPSWDARQGEVAFSDFGDWHDVARWVAPRVHTEPRAAEVVAAAARLRVAADDDRGRVLAVASLVNDDIETADWTLGFAPRSPAQSLSDGAAGIDGKAVLAHALLRELGIESTLALVRGEGDVLLAGRVPSPLAFDRMVVRARVGDDIAWIDPVTAVSGDAVFRQPRYHWAMIVGDDGGAVESVPLPDNRQPTRIIVEHFRSDGARTDDATLRVESRYLEHEADTMRAQLEQHPREEIEQSYLEYYQGWHPGIERRGRLTSEQLGGGRIVALDEQYWLPQFWIDDRRDFDAREVNNALPTPAADRPSAALALPYPLHYHYTIRIDVPGNYEWGAVPVTIDNDFFEFTFAERATASGGELVYTLRTKTDHVTAGRIPEYAAAVARLNDEYGGYYLTNVWYVDPDAPAPERPLWALILGGMLAAVLGLGFLYSAREQLRARRG